MKKSKSNYKETNHLELVNSIIRHIDHVRQNTRLLGEKLIKIGEIELGISLIANGEIHDNSKFRGMEYDNLSNNSKNKKLLQASIYQHNRTNPHHPDYWGNIQSMPNVYIAEMVCDLAARSSEFGTSVTEWIENIGTKRYNFKMDDSTGKLITNYLNLLLDEPFKPVT